MACGGSIRTRAAASSMARGNPSRRQQISATAGAFSLSMAKSGLTAWARAMKSRTASYWESCSSGGGGLRRGRPRGAPDTPARRAGAAASGSWPAPSALAADPSRFPTAGAASTRCSKLSRTRSNVLCRQEVSQAVRQRLPALLAHAQRRRDRRRRPDAGSASGASGTKKTPSAKSSSSSAAACNARRVLPVPPGPISVTSWTSGGAAARRSPPPAAPGPGTGSAGGAGCSAGCPTS